MSTTPHRPLMLYGALIALALTVFAWVTTTRLTIGSRSNRADFCGLANGVLVWTRESSESRYREQRMVEIEYEMVMGWRTHNWRPPKVPSPDPNRFEKAGAYWFTDTPGGWIVSEHDGSPNLFPKPVFKWEWNSTTTDPVSGAALGVVGARHVAMPLWLVALLTATVTVTLFIRHRRTAIAIAQNQCGSCGYSLHGLPSSCLQCPECGVTAAATFAG